jgi:hypothetical protein
MHAYTHMSKDYESSEAWVQERICHKYIWEGKKDRRDT